MNALLRPDVIWFVIGVAFFLVELMAPAMFSLFLGIGAVAVSVACMAVDLSFTAQLIVFLATSLLTLVFLRRRFREIFSGGERGKGDELMKIVGEKVRVIEAIDDGRPGRVELNGAPWSAESDARVEAGEFVVVAERKGLVLKVKPLERK
jgi:inner membrane protein